MSSRALAALAWLALVSAPALADTEEELSLEALEALDDGRPTVGAGPTQVAEHSYQRWLLALPGALLLLVAWNTRWRASVPTQEK